jgi:alkylhydroperoxidase family enzyme
LKKLLNAQGLSDQEIDLKISSIMSDGAEYEFGKLESKMMQYATKLSLTPSEILETDVVELRNSGMTDLAIHDLCSIVAYFNFVNRIANGLGVELER